MKTFTFGSSSKKKVKADSFCSCQISENLHAWALAKRKSEGHANREVDPAWAWSFDVVWKKGVRDDLQDAQIETMWCAAAKLGWRRIGAD